MQIEAEMKKLWSSKDNCVELKNHFEIQFEITIISNSPTSTLRPP